MYKVNVTYRVGVVFRDARFLFNSARYVVYGVVELGRVVVDVQYVDDDRRSVSVFLIENEIRQLITLVIDK